MNSTSESKGNFLRNMPIYDQLLFTRSVVMATPSVTVDYKLFQMMPYIKSP